MDPSEIYAKTELGVQELRERTLNLPVALRSLLILIDGRRTIGEVLDKARALRLDERALASLERGGLIVRRFSAPSAGGATATPAEGGDDTQRQRVDRAQALMREAIQAHLGLAGYALRTRVQKCANLRDVHDLLPDLARALVKRLGIERATPIVEAIERLISPA
jgi:hypothetical protein